MRVLMTTWHSKRDVHLSEALTPSLDVYECEGELERVKRLGEKSAEAFGRLAALLVEKGVLSLDEAIEASGVTNEVSAI